ncbi:MAG: GntR family transcriptional regulator [Chloroflexi bacterium]|nr:GntR family transcriptional regulator [Chloroflexota bacterium]
MHNGQVSKNKTERAYTVIRERIFNGTYVPGYRLVIDGLAQELNISTVPIREAIRRLEAEGWIEYRHNAGAQVALADAGKYEEELAVLALLESNAAAIAAPYLTPEDINSLRQLNASMLDAIESADLHTFSRLNKEFHFFIYERCPNGYLVKLLRETWDRLGVRGHTDFSYIPQRARESIKEHEQFLSAVEQQMSGSEIEQMVREHKLRTRAAYLNSPRYRSPSSSTR